MLTKDKLFNILSSVSQDKLFKIENSDPQFKALCKLTKHRAKQQVLDLSIANSLICFQLSGKGEDCWNEFSDFFSNKQKSFDHFKEFLLNSKSNHRLVNLKLNRIKRFRQLIPLNKNLSFKDMWQFLSYNMKSNKQSKTIVFSVKIYGYLKRCLFNEYIPFPFEIPLPFDSRIKKLEYLGIKNQEQWSSFARQVNIAPLHLDSILWLSLRQGLPFFEENLMRVC